MTLRREWLVVIVLAIALAAPVAHAQVICVEYDANTPLYSGARDVDHDQFTTGRGPAFRVGWLSKKYASGVGGDRWSFFVGRQTCDTIWRTLNPYPSKESATTIELGHDLCLWARPRVFVSAGAAWGVTLVSSKNMYSGQCSEMFCNLPDGGMEFSAYTNVEFPVSTKFGMMIGLRSRILGPAREDVYPFAPGPIVSIGVQLN